MARVVVRASLISPTSVVAAVRSSPTVSPASITDPALFVQTGAATGFVQPGYFDGGARTTPASGTWYNVQVRIWESAYGGSYEEAVAAPEMNGRPTLRAESNVFSVLSGGGISPPGCS